MEAEVPEGLVAEEVDMATWGGRLVRWEEGRRREAQLVRWEGGRRKGLDL
jgi:hypothetical protein